MHRVNIAIASPTDVVAERNAVLKVFSRWNNANESAFLNAVMWESASVPALGDHPQDILNEQIVERSDLLLGILWSKLGTPTPRAPSGTVAEIRRFVSSKGAGRVMLYFCTRDLPYDIHAGELARLRKFKADMRSQGLYHEYSSVADFERDLYRHLDMKVKDLLADHFPVHPPLPERRRNTSETILSYNTVTTSPGTFVGATITVAAIDIIGLMPAGDNSVVRNAIRALHNALIDIFEDFKWDEPDIDNDIVMLPTHNGYGVAFSPQVPDGRILKDVMQLSVRLRQEGFPVRIGINKGPCLVYEDVNGNLNLAGWGYIDATLTMSLGNKNHILCTTAFAHLFQGAGEDVDFTSIGHYSISGRHIANSKYGSSPESVTGAGAPRSSGRYSRCTSRASDSHTPDG